jgi:hypothetical protein
VRFDLLSVATNKRDVFIRALQRPADANHVETNFYVVKTLSEALAIDDVVLDADFTTTGLIAYKEDVVMGGAPATISMTNHAANAPDMTGMKLEINGSGDSSDWDGLWGYSAGLSQLVLDEIENILGDYMGSGQSLEPFIAARVVKGPEDLVVMGMAPQIIAAVSDEPETFRQAGDFAADVNFSIIVGDRGMKNKGETNYLNVMGYGGAIRSILGDENITLNGVTVETVISSVEGPVLIEGEGEPYVAAKVNGVCHFPVLESDA